MKRVLVLGGYGVFGSLIATDLAGGGIGVTVAGRDRKKAEAFASSLGHEGRGLALDTRDALSFLEIFREHAVVIHCAGPFFGDETAVVEACLKAGCHYVDIADDRAYVASVRAFDARFRDSGLAAIYGCSSLPGISGALALRLKAEDAAPPERIRVTLFIGNKNPKGEAAVRSAFRVLGKTIQAPQGEIRGFGDPETVSLPPPWGERRVYNFESPEYDHFPAEFGAKSVSVKLGFEMKSVTRLFALLSRAPASLCRNLLKPLLAVGNLGSRLGSSGGAVVVEFFGREGTLRRAILSAPEGGQKMAIRPAVLSAQTLLSGPLPPKTGAMTVYAFNPSLIAECRWEGSVAGG